MAQDIVSGLFGLSPEMYQQQMAGQALAEGAKLGQMSPDAFGRAMLYSGGAQLGRGLGGALGAQDPQLQLLSQRNAVMRGVDLNDINSIMQGVRDLSQFDPQGASALAGLAREAQSKQAEAAQKIAQATKAMAETGEIAAKRESLNSRVQALIDAQIPESMAKGIASNDKAFAEFVAARNIATPADYAVQARALGFEVKPFLKDYTPEQIQAMESGVFKHKAGVAKAGATSLNVDVRQPVEISKNKTDLAAQIEKDAYSSSDRITLSQNLRNLLPRAFVGVGSDVALQAGKVAEAFGIDVKGVAPSQIIDTILNEMTVGKAGELKGALSDKDREFLKATIGTRGLSIKTLNYVADEIERRASIDKRLNSRVNNYIASGKNLNTIDFAEERSQAGKDVQKDLDRLRELRQKAGQQ